MRRDDERLIDVREAARAARRFVKGRSAQDVATDELLAAALIQKITIIGEAAGRVSEARQTELAQLPWRGTYRSFSSSWTRSVFRRPR
jgi:uncharacterized protein with HEPN domain